MMEVVHLPIDLLYEAGWNPNIMEDAMMEKLKSSLEKYGQVEILVVREVAPNGYEVLGGNHRLRAL